MVREGEVMGVEMGRVVMVLGEKVKVTEAEERVVEGMVKEDLGREEMDLEMESLVRGGSDWVLQYVKKV